MDILIIVVAAIIGLIIMLFLLLKSNDNLDFKINLKKGEMNLRKRKQ